MALPQMRVALIAPEPMLTDRAFVRIHNRAAKDSLRGQAIGHWKKRLPGHFQATARSKYGYKDRTPKYKAIKYRQGYGRTDLVRTGANKRKMLGEEPQIRAGGRAANPDGTAGQLRLSMILRFTFGAAAQVSTAKRIATGQRRGIVIDKRATAGVTIDQMRKEIATILPSEGGEIAQGFAKGYTVHLQDEISRRPRIRKRIEALNRS